MPVFFATPIFRILRSILTSERRLHGRLNQSCEQLRRLWLHGEAGGEGAQGLGVPRQALQGHALPIVGLQMRQKGMSVAVLPDGKM